MKIYFLSYLAEYIGTFFFVLSILASAGNPLVIGASLALVVYLVSNISGGNINPAVSIAMYMNGTLTYNNLFSYILAQLLGGFSAFYAYKFVT